MSNLALNPNLVGDEASELNVLIEGWLKREQDGEQFPVNFDAAWQLVGYSTKGNAKRKLIGKNRFAAVPRLNAVAWGRIAG